MKGFHSYSISGFRGIDEVSGNTGAFPLGGEERRATEWLRFQHRQPIPLPQPLRRRPQLRVVVQDIDEVRGGNAEAVGGLAYLAAEENHQVEHEGDDGEVAVVLRVDGQLPLAVDLRGYLGGNGKSFHIHLAPHGKHQLQPQPFQRQLPVLPLHAVLISDHRDLRRAMDHIDGTVRFVPLLSTRPTRPPGVPIALLQ